MATRSSVRAHKPVRIRSAASQLRGAKVRANKAKGDALADALAVQVRSFMGDALREHRFAAPDRQWRFDLCWPCVESGDPTRYGKAIACEIEGGAFVRGGHTRGAHFRSDVEKYAEAACLGWVVLRVMPEHVRSGQAAAWLKRISGGTP